MYLFILLILVVVFHPKKHGFTIVSNLEIQRDQKANEQKNENIQQLKINAEKRYKKKKDKITNEERQGILTSHSYM